MRKHEFETIGTHFAITVWDDMPETTFVHTMHACERICTEFDKTYSRFIETSLVRRLSRMTGIHEVPHDLVAMLRVYEEVYTQTGGKVNPCVGNTLTDLGYDATYTLVPKQKSEVRSTPPMVEALHIVDDTRIELYTECLLDFGALGKGFLIDKIYEYLATQKFTHYLVDGSGDIRYMSPAPGVPLRCALEHPRDANEAIGVKTIIHGALCASALGRRAWPDGSGGTLHHYIDPTTSHPTRGVEATWVYADTATYADAYASALFFAEPHTLSSTLEYCVVDMDLKRKNATNFAEFFA